MKFTILKRLLLGNFVIMIMVMFMGGYVFLKLNQLNQIISNIAFIDVNTVRNLELMSTTLEAQLTLEKKYLILKDKDFYDKFKKTSRYFQETINQVEPMFEIAEEIDLLNSMKKSYDRYLNLFEGEVLLIMKGEKRSREKYESERDILTNQIVQRLREIIFIESRERSNKIELSNRISYRVLRVSTITAMLTVFVGILISFLNTRWINRPIKLLKKKTREIALERFIEIHEITSPPEIKELADDFNIMSKRLRELDEIKMDFISNVSHELRTPLTAIREATGMLMEKRFTPSPKDRNDLLIIIHDECERLIASVNRILDLSRMESGMMDYQFKPGSLNQLLQKIVLKLAPIAVKKKIELELKPLPELPMVNMDEDKIGYVLENILGNALKYSPEKGVTTVVASLIKNDERKFIQVSVSDKGPGISKEDQDKIFDKFKRVKLVEKTERGTGLGLSIAKHIISEHGGRIWVESELGKGSIFYFILPAL